MADEPQEQPGQEEAEPVEEDGEAELHETDDPEGDEVDPQSPIKPSMTEQEIKGAGVAVDVPFETATPNPEEIQYASGIAKEPFELPEGWPAEPGEAAPVEEPPAK